MARDAAEMLAMGERIKELRKASGLKQQYIADQCGVELRTYQFWQQGKHPPTGDALVKLAELFGVTTKYILRGSTPNLAGNGESAEKLDRIEDRLTAIATTLGELRTAVQVLGGAVQDIARRLPPADEERRRPAS